MTLAHQLWDRFGTLGVQDLSPAAHTLATQCLLDWSACALAGTAEPLAAILRDELGGVAGRCTVVGSTLKAAPAQAAMINGAVSHALDFDDTHTIMGGHPSVPLFPAALAIAEDQGASGADLLAAFVAGFEIECRLGVALGGRPYGIGWHVTSVVGVFGAAAAAAHLLGLNGDQFAHAMGIAASQASGVKANFGTMTKPLHAGQAAERGVLSARLAARGFTANPDAFTANQGLLQATGSDGLREDRRDDVLDTVGGEWLITKTLFKYHAACYLTHAAIESTLASASKVNAGNVQRVTLTVHPSILNVCGIAEPKTGLEAKFSLRATTAMTLLGLDTSDPATFNDRTVQSDAVQELLHKVDVETSREMANTETSVQFHLADGSRHESCYDSGIPAQDLEAQGRKLHGKFDALVAPVIGRDAADALADRIGRIESLASAGELFA